MSEAVDIDLDHLPRGLTGRVDIEQLTEKADDANGGH